MNYNKPALPFHDQANLLISRGLIVQNQGDLETYLQNVNYYRLSGYWYIFKTNDPNTGDEIFKSGTTFSMIQERYELDRKLRLLIMDAIERIEVAIFRTRLVEINTKQYGPFGYALLKNYNPKFAQMDFQKLMTDIAEDELRSREEFIVRYRAKYMSEKYLPLWMVVEIMSFGQLLTLYRNQDLSIKKILARQFNLFPMVLDSWLLTLNYVRNCCAHHSRLWNRPLPLPIKLPDKKYDINWYNPIQIPSNNIFSISTIIQYLLSFILPVNPWKNMILQLIATYPSIPLKPMGFPIDWHKSPLWK